MSRKQINKQQKQKQRWGQKTLDQWYDEDYMDFVYASYEAGTSET